MTVRWKIERAAKEPPYHRPQRNLVRAGIRKVRDACLQLRLQAYQLGSENLMWTTIVGNAVETQSRQMSRNHANQ
jgi:hypothetical protein